MIEETDTDIEVRKYADAQAARELGVEPYPSLAGTSINPLPPWYETSNSVVCSKTH